MGETTKRTTNSNLSDQLAEIRITLERRVERLESEVAELRRAIRGYNGDTGLVDRVSRMEEKMADIKKLAWAILLVVLGLVVTQIWQLIAAAP